MSPSDLILTPPANSDAVSRRLWRRLRDKGIRYWLTAFFIFLLAITGSSYVYAYLHLTEYRNQFFQLLLDWGPNPRQPKFVRIVLIGDDDYWRGYLAGRRPIKRDYLAALVDKLVSANAHIIAIDIDARLPDPTSEAIPSDYKEETRAFIRAIVKAANRGKKVVLATPISIDEEGHYCRDSDIYQSYGLCKGNFNSENTGAGACKRRQISKDLPDSTIDIKAAANKNITCGYIALPYDPLAVPGQLTMVDGSYLDSFALSVARAKEPDLIRRILERVGNKVKYSNFISSEMFAQANAQLSAHAILEGAVDSERLEAATVIIGGYWRMFAADRGPLVDLHRTPAGQMVGALLHANYVAALLDDRTFSAAPSWILHGTEVVFSLIAMVAFALIPGFWGKLIGIISLFILLLFIQWSALHGLGVFFDALVPLLGLGLHSIYERLFASRHH
jgi:CHASE2 domain-containing sensor protein